MVLGVDVGVGLGVPFAEALGVGECFDGDTDGFVEGVADALLGDGDGVPDADDEGPVVGVAPGETRWVTCCTVVALCCRLG